MWKPYKGLFHSQIKRIQQVYPILKKIQEVADVPWQAMAAIWYRESFSIAPPKTPGGPWQFDPVPSVQTMNTYLTKIGMNTQQKAEIIHAGVNDFYAGGVLAACHLKMKADWKLTKASPESVLMNAIYGYNGKKYGGALKSPYVINGYDEAHYPMRLRGTIPDGKGGRKWIDIKDTRPGAFTIYKQLKELFP